MQMDVDWVRKVVQMVSQCHVYEVAIQGKKGSLRIKKGDMRQDGTGQLSSNEIALMPKAKTRTIVSNYVGRIQLGQDVLHPLIGVGDSIAEGQVVAFIQAFDTITPIVADKEGTVEAVCVKDHDKVEYGTVILKLA